MCIATAAHRFAMTMMKEEDLTGTAVQVLWTRGTRDINEMPKIGLPAPEFLEATQ